MTIIYLSRKRKYCLFHDRKFLFFFFFFQFQCYSSNYPDKRGDLPLHFSTWLKSRISCTRRTTNNALSRKISAHKREAIQDTFQEKWYESNDSSNFTVQSSLPLNQIEKIEAQMIPFVIPVTHEVILFFIFNILTF